MEHRQRRVKTPARPWTKSVNSRLTVTFQGAGGEAVCGGTARFHKGAALRKRPTAAQNVMVGALSEGRWTWKPVGRPGAKLGLPKSSQASRLFERADHQKSSFSIQRGLAALECQ